MESLPRSKQLNAYFRENAVIKLIFNLNYIKFKFNDISLAISIYRILKSSI